MECEDLIYMHVVQDRVKGFYDYGDEFLVL
jgi:hypothetical protein